MNVKLETSVTFDFITSNFSTGAAADADSTPSFEVFEDTTDTALTLSTSSIAKRTSKTGNYRATFTVAAADGFEAGKSYNVIASATVNSVAGKGVIGRFIASSKDVDDLAADCTAISERLEEQVPDGPVVVIPSPGSETQTVAWCVCYNPEGEVEEGVKVYVRAKAGGSASSAFDSRSSVGVSSEDGVVNVVIPRDASLFFEAKRGGGAWVTFRGEDAETLELPAIIGMP